MKFERYYAPVAAAYVLGNFQATFAGDVWWMFLPCGAVLGLMFAWAAAIAVKGPKA